MSPDVESTSGGLFDLPERFASWCGAVIRENFKAVVAIVVVGLALWLFGVVSLPAVTIPLWVRVIVTFGALAAIGGYAAAAIHFNAPEPDWNRVVAVNLDDPQPVRITKATDAVVADMRVVGGRELTNPPGTSIYLCRWFNGDAENPTAIVTWKDVPSDWEVLGTKPSAIEDEIAALRDTYEETHGKHRWVLDHLYMVVRKLDFRRSQSQDRVLEDHLAPSFEDDSIAEVVDETVPEELRPDRSGVDVGDGDDRELDSDDVVDDVQDDLEAGGDRGGADLPAVADGGDRGE